MTAYIIRRLALSVLLLVAASLMAFMILKAAPGDYFTMLKADPRIPQEYVDQQREIYGLDKPSVVQYGLWIKNAIVGDLGYSFAYKQPVSSVIGTRVFNTLVLNSFAILITWMVAIPVGVYASVRQYSIGDKLLSALSFVGMSFPSFFSALILLYIFSSVLGVLPPGGMYSIDYHRLSLGGKMVDVARHLVIPVIVLVMLAMARLQRITRGNMLEILGQQYIRTARAKGLPEHRVIYKHALRNALNPLITIFGYEFGALLSGSALLEIILDYPGLGSLIYTAVRSQDQFLVMGGFMMGAVMLLLGNLLAELLLAWVDPRISYK
ncbi:MAG: ABC transporter permease [Planctomycetota bacterium]|jgi:peptide/nickel transport system permease protein